MSLFIILKKKDIYGNEIDFERHIPFNDGTLPRLENEEIEFIQADGDELQAIIQLFTVVPVKILDDGSHSVGGRAQITIPLPDKRVVKWYGEMARFIYQNIR